MRKIKYLISVFVALCIVIGVGIGLSDRKVSAAGNYTIDVSALSGDQSGTGWGYNSRLEVLRLSEGTFHLNTSGSTLSSTRIVVEGTGSDIYVYLHNYKADFTNVALSPFTISDSNKSNVYIVLVGESRIAAGNGHAAIEKLDSKALTIDGEGTLFASGRGGGAGIGTPADYSTYCQKIIINNGLIFADSYDGGAGIGGGRDSGVDNVLINGGTVYATAHKDSNGNKGAGIGAGACVATKSANYRNIRIYSGVVYADGYCGLGYGSGFTGSVYSINDSYIFDGNLTLTSDVDYAVSLEARGGSIITNKALNTKGYNKKFVEIDGFAPNTMISESVVVIDFGDYDKFKMTYSLHNVFADPDGKIHLWVRYENGYRYKTSSDPYPTSMYSYPNMYMLSMYGQNCSGNGWNYDGVNDTLITNGNANVIIRNYISGSTNIALDASGSSKDIVIDGIDISLDSKPPIYVTAPNTGKINLIFKGANYITSTDKFAAIQKTSDAGSLKISGDGYLDIYSYGGGAGIGSPVNGNDASNILIDGPFMYIHTYGSGAAAIGGGLNSGCKNITIDGGIFSLDTARSASFSSTVSTISGTAIGAGVPESRNTTANNININGGLFAYVRGNTAFGAAYGNNSSYASTATNVKISGGSFYIAALKNKTPYIVTGGAFAGDAINAVNADGEKLREVIVNLGTYPIGIPIYANDWNVYLKNFRSANKYIDSLMGGTYGINDLYSYGGNLHIYIPEFKYLSIGIPSSSGIVAEAVDTTYDDNPDTLYISGSATLGMLNTGLYNPDYEYYKEYPGYITKAVIADEVKGITGKILYEFPNLQTIEINCNAAGVASFQKYYGDMLSVQHEVATYPYVAPKCTEPGYMGGTYCANCEIELTTRTIINPTGHQNIGTQSAVPASCTSTGLTKGEYCLDCNTVLVAQKTVDKLPHTSVKMDKVDATCTEDGHYAGTKCSVCDTVLSGGATIKAKGHTSVIIPEVPATCTESGLTSGVKCGVCGTTLESQRFVSATGHTPKTIPAVPATCVQMGYTSGTECATCHYVMTAPVSTGYGSHTVVTDPAVKGSCTEDAKTEGSHCSVCNTTIVAQKVTPAPGHNIVTSPGLAPTETTPGYTDSKVCTRCGYVQQASTPIPPTGKPNPNPDADKLGDFVERLYQVALGRNADPAGKASWVQVLKDGTSGADVAKGFLYSPEFTSKNLSDADYIDALYKIFFDRPADPEGKQSWLDFMKMGATKQYVLEGFIGSKEWSLVCADYGIKTGADTPNDVSAFVTRLYTTCLGRTPDAAGHSAWLTALVSHQGGGSKVAHNFFFSDEFVNAKLSNEAYVTRLYITMMNRMPDAEGKKGWVDALEKGTSREAVFQGFANSIEWGIICDNYGIDK